MVPRTNAATTRKAEAGLINGVSDPSNQGADAHP